MKFLTKVTKGSIFGFDYSMYYIVLLPPEVFKVLRLVLKEKTSDNFFGGQNKFLPLQVASTLFLEALAMRSPGH